MTSLPGQGFGPDPAEAAAVAADFGVGAAQVERDHLISHVLAALARDDLAARLTFFGGTALSRTLLPHLRLSEDIDLIARGSRPEVAVDVMAAVDRALSRTHGRVTWTPPLDRTVGAGASVLAVQGTPLRIQVQLLSDEGYPRWPTTRRWMHQRYTDAPPATLRTLTPPAFVASKLVAWHHRRAARDLYDLWGLAAAGFIGAEAVTMFARLGPTNRLPPASLFTSLPAEHEWSVALAHQCRLSIGPRAAGGAVREAVRTAVVAVEAC